MLDFGRGFQIQRPPKQSYDSVLDLVEWKEKSQVINSEADRNGFGKGKKTLEEPAERHSANSMGPDLFAAQTLGCLSSCKCPQQSCDTFPCSCPKSCDFGVSGVGPI